uniref:Uncharacterized protein n=1 Tax=Arundo donax TaxID=35708 RepID=A0A0A9DEL4_ARUDO
MKRKKGMTKSATVTPSHGEWFIAGRNAPASSTMIISSTVIPRNTSSETSRCRGGADADDGEGPAASLGGAWPLGWS